eukprot:524186-Rhodomonas_salina.1
MICPTLVREEMRSNRRSNAGALLFAAATLSLVPAVVCWKSIELAAGRPTLRNAFINLQLPKLWGKRSSVCNSQTRGVHMRGSETSASVSESGAKGVGTEAAKIRVVSFDLDDTLWPTGD